MSESKKKTEKIVRKNLPIDALVPNPDNPNEMSDAEFNMLYDNMEKMGFTEPVLVRPIEGGQYRIVGGHHRVEVGKLLDYTEVPCTVIDDPAFTDEQEQFQLVRMNVIHGKMSPEKFLKLYEKLSDQYTQEVLQESFGFTDEEEFQKLIKQMARNLPPEMQQEFMDAAQEMKTIDGLSQLLNTMFNRYGDTLDYGYMVVDFGGKESIWLRMEPKTMDAAMKVGDLCRQHNRTMDDIVGGLMQLIAKGELADAVQALVDSSQPAVLPKEGWPTKELLATLDQSNDL